MFVFSRVWTEYGEIRSIFPYSVQIREGTDQKKLRIWTLFTQCVSSTLRRYLMQYVKKYKQEYLGAEQIKEYKTKKNSTIVLRIFWQSPRKNTGGIE